MANLSPTELLNRVRASAKLDTKEFEKQVAIKLNKPGKIKLQLLALDSEHLFKARTQHYYCLYCRHCCLYCCLLSFSSNISSMFSFKAS